MAFTDSVGGAHPCERRTIRANFAVESEPAWRAVMCGRFSQMMTWRQVHDLYQLLGSRPVHPSERRNGCPTQDFAVCRLDPDGSGEAASLRWGLVPPWAKDRRMAGRMINARSETVKDKPAFRAAFRSRRCLIPANRWFEWRREGSDGPKRPWLIESADGLPLSFAGIWERWSHGRASIETFSILTEEASEELRHLNHRQPVVIAPSCFGEWLSAERSPWSDVPEEWLSIAAVRSGFTWRPVEGSLDDTGPSTASLFG